MPEIIAGDEIKPDLLSKKTKLVGNGVVDVDVVTGAGVVEVVDVVVDVVVGPL